jgi:hypothetical protein
MWRQRGRLTDKFTLPPRPNSLLVRRDRSDFPATAAMGQGRLVCPSLSALPAM